jgi:hypothetical protein
MISSTWPSISRGIATTPSNGSQKIISPYRIVDRKPNAPHSQSHIRKRLQTHRRNSNTANRNRHIASTSFRLGISPDSRSSPRPDLSTNTTIVSNTLPHTHSFSISLEQTNRKTRSP